MSEKYANKENLERFWGNAKEYIGNERKEIEDQLYNWQKTEKAPVVQCEPVPNSELHPTVEFKFKEILSDGEKGPNNPSTITGMSSVNVGHVGKNLLLRANGSYTGYTVARNSDGSLSISGSGAALISITDSAPNASGTKSSVRLDTSKTYTLSVEVVSGTVGANSGTVSIAYNSSVENTVTIPTSGKAFFSFIPLNSVNGQFVGRLNLPSTASFTNAVLRIQLEEGNIATDFEAPMLPTEISATISLDETRYGGILDLTTGLMTVTHFCSELTSSNLASANYAEQTFGSRLALNVNGGLTAFPKADFSTSNNFTLSHLTYQYPTGNGLNFGFFWASSPYLTFQDANYQITTSGASAVENKQAFLDWFDAKKANNNPVILTYKLATPFTVQLTPQQIKSLPSLEGTSKRINTLYTDADSIQVEYQKYVGIDSTLDSDSVNAIQNKVVNSALNTKVSLSGDETINGTKTFSSTINGSITGNAGTVAGHVVSKDVPINAAFTDTTYDPATQSTAGLMSASDKVKLDAVGSVFTFKGSVIDDTYLPASDNVNGDAYLAEDTGHVHVYDGTNFVDIGVWAGIPSATDAQIDALFED